jgi:hypothetical protein
MIKETLMKNSWLIWAFLIGVVVTVFMAFNYESSSRTRPLTEIFPDEEIYPVDVEYEFVDESATELPVEKTGLKDSIKDLSQNELIQSIKSVEELDSGAHSISTTDVNRESNLQEAKMTGGKDFNLPVEANVLSKDDSLPNFTIQVGSFKKQSQAKLLKDKLLKQNHVAYVAERNLKNKGTWYRVYVGKFDSQREAQTALGKVKESYEDSFIITPQK